MTFLWLYFSFHLLGHPDCRVRDAASGRADCLLGAILAPADTTNPEVGRRVGWVRARRLSSCPPLLLTWLADRPEFRPDVLRVLAQNPERHRPVLAACRPLPPAVAAALYDRISRPCAEDRLDYGVMNVALDAHLSWNRPGRVSLEALGGGLVR